MSLVHNMHELAQATAKDLNTNDVATVVAGVIGAATSGIDLRDPLAISMQSVVVIATVTYVVFRAIKMFYEMREARHRVIHMDDHLHHADRVQPDPKDSGVRPEQGESGTDQTSGDC